jgi:peptide/nickel transport system substrate-binding protein
VGPARPQPQLTPSRARGADDVVIAAFDAPMTVDPHAAFDTGSRHVVLNVYESLLRFDERVRGFHPWLATEVVCSDDGLRYRFPVRSGVLDHRGHRVSAADAQYSVRRSIITAPGPGSLWLSALLGPERADPAVLADLVEACSRVHLDGDAIVIELTRPFEPFLAVVAQWSLVLSQRWAVGRGAWTGDIDSIADYVSAAHEPLDVANGTGPYALERLEREPRALAVFGRHGQYWREVRCPPRVTITAIQDRLARECALLDGRADYAVCQPESLSRLAGAQDVVCEQTRDEWHINPLGIVTYTLAADAPAAERFPRRGLSDLRLRRALSLAFDYERFVAEALHGDAIEHPGPFPGPALPDGPRPAYTFDLERAGYELRQAWDGAAVADGFELAIYTHRDNYAREVAAEILAEGFNELHARCRVSVVAVGFDQLVRDTFAGRCPVAWLSWDADYLHPYAFGRELLSSAALLPRSTGMRLEGADALLHAALLSNDERQRAHIYGRLAQSAIEACCYLFVPGKVSYLSYHARWTGVRLFPGTSNVLDFASFTPRAEVPSLA